MGTRPLGWCSPWQWLEFVLFPVGPARAGVALGLGVPQLTVKPFSDSERRGSVTALTCPHPQHLLVGVMQGKQKSSLHFPPCQPHVPGKNRAREGQVRAQVSFLPDRLQLSMAFEAPGLL